AREDQAGLLDEVRRGGELPERIVHNDTKLNNILFHATTGEILCVVDLDTVMPGSILHDFGDLVRSSVCPAEEGVRYAGRTEVRLPVFEALVRGYLEGAGGILTSVEVELLAFSVRLITLELAVRFLTDYLAGDIYFQAAYPEHNLDRCRNQLRLLLELERHFATMETLVKEIACGHAG
ncbi:MAG: phosphotransferase, partial [Gammaproteobacteria bacterium]|nr:phosphotransferase [Gammaproteobacteria bacterium]